MGVVTRQTLLSFGYNFKDDQNLEIDAIIANHEKDYYDAALSPQLADVYITDPSDARFSAIRATFIDDNNNRQKGLDHGANAWCAWWIVKENSLSIINGKITTPTSKNEPRLDAPQVWGKETYNLASDAAYAVTVKVMEDSETFPEFTEGECLEHQSFWL